MIAVSIVLEKIENCYLPKLSRNLEECENHNEFELWNKNLNENFPAVINLLTDFNIKDSGSPSTVVSSLLLVYLQLQSKGPWKTAKCEECAQKLNYNFQLLYEIPLLSLLKTNPVHDAQEVFNKSIELIHQRLTPTDFKKYPALIEAYVSIIKDIKNYDILMKPVQVVPVSLLLVEDYVNDNRLKGLRCYSSILKCLTPEHFKEGNYYEVMYRTIKKIVIERDLEITKLTLECLFDLLMVLPPHAKVSTTDQILGILLDQIYTESNLYRKKEMFTFINKIIHKHGVHCVKRNMFLPIICDNLDICLNETVGEILLLPVIECLENWIKYCWCVWKLTANKRLMTALFKILYVSKNKEDVATKVQNIIIALCKLSSREEVISCCIEKQIQDVKTLSEEYALRLQNIEKHIH